MTSPCLLLTGASGFIGRELAARHPSAPLSLARPDWLQAIGRTPFRGRVVVHLAGLAQGGRVEAEALLRANVDKTTALARAAASGGAARFVFLSTVKVHGEESVDRALVADSPPAPADAYARSKWLAEEALREVAARSGMPWVVVRAPLVYGRAARGNFAALVRLAALPVWLPFGSVRNRRSLVHVRDLVDALYLAAVHPQAAGRVLMAAHPVPVSTADLIGALRRQLGRPERLLPLPPRALEALAGMAGLHQPVCRLTRSLEVDPTYLVSEFGWQPQFDLREGLREAVP